MSNSKVPSRENLTSEKVFEMNKRVFAVLALGLLSGCTEAMIVAGNGLSMVVACTLLYSTVNLSRPPKK